MIQCRWKWKQGKMKANKINGITEKNFINNMQTQKTMEKFTIDNARNYGWMVLSPTNKTKPVALFNNHDHAVLFAATVYGERETWEVKSCDIRIPLYCY